ncbi:MAG: ATP-binding protein [Gemmatimonadaceae bacterium]
MKPSLRTTAIWVGATSALLVLVAVLTPYRGQIYQVHVVLPVLLLVLLSSTVGGERLGFFLAAIGFVAIDVVFQPPYGEISFRQPRDWVVLLSFGFTAVVATRLLTRARNDAEQARRRSAEVQQMADLGSAMLSAVTPAEALRTVAATLREILKASDCTIARALPNGELELVASDGASRDVSAMERMGDVHAQLATRAWPDEARYTDRAGTGASTRSDKLSMLRQLLDTQGAGVNDTSGEMFATPVDGRLVLPLHADGRTVGVLTIDDVAASAWHSMGTTTLRGLTQYAALGLDRLRLHAEAAHADALREADRMKDMVLASVSHDLRTPLTTIKLLAAAGARRGEVASVQIEEEADRLARMVGDLLDLSRARSGQWSLALDLNTLEDLVGAAMRQLNPMLGERRVIRDVRDEAGPLVGKFDFVAALRVLVNLLENAAKYSPAESVIDLIARRDGEWLMLEIQDRGPGVPDEDCERIFTPFFRSPERPANVPGAGLGLAVARMLAEAQGGRLTYAARERGGSVFTFALPAHDSPEVEDEEPLTEERPTALSG